MDPDTFKAIAESSQTLISWALALFGGSIATIIGTSHISPAEVKARLIYLLFVPAWICLAVSVWFGDAVARNYLAALVSKASASDILREINTAYHLQQQSLLISVYLLSCWLVVYLLWWVFLRPPPKQK